MKTRYPASFKSSCFATLGLIVLFLLSTQSLTAQQTVDYDGHPAEKVFAHPDKRIYAAGERLYAAIYLVDGKWHLPDTTSGVVYVELRGPEGTVLGRRMVYPAGGHAAADFQLPTDLEPNIYRLVAYTNYQRNWGTARIFQTPIQIVSGLEEAEGAADAEIKPNREVPSDYASYPATATSKKVTLRFFPEGGDCVVGMRCRVAVVAEDAGGRPVEIQGFLRNAGEERPLLFFATRGTGVGHFRYSPVAGQRLEAYVNDQPTAYALPAPRAEGYALSVTNSADSITVGVRSNTATGLAGSRVEINVRGAEVLLPTLPRSAGVAIQLIKDSLRAGLYTATLYDPRNEPVAERLFFVAPTQKDSIQLVMDRERYGLRDTVRLRAGMPAGRISYAVLPVTSTTGPVQDDIRSWLLLNSELPKPIAPLPLLLNAEREDLRDLDIDDFLLTRGWRRFARIPTITAASDSFRRERGLYLDGRLLRPYTEGKPRKGKVWFNTVENPVQVTTLTDEDGKFSFGPFVTFDTLNIVLQARYRNSEKRFNNSLSLDDNRSVDIAVDQYRSPILPDRRWTFPATQAVIDPADQYTSLSSQVLSVARSYDSLVIDLATVNVKARRIDQREEEIRSRTGMFSNPNSRIVADSVPWRYGALSFVDLIRMEPGVRITGTTYAPNIVIRGINSISLSSQPAYFLDGVPVDINALVTLPVMDIDFIDIFKGPGAAIFGSRGAGGAILVYTRRGSNVTRTVPGVVDVKFPGYHVARQFPVFAADAAGNAGRPDFRTTLFWEPFLFTSRRGVAEQTFTTSDQPGRFIIIAQGLTNDGQPLTGTATFRVSTAR